MILSGETQADKLYVTHVFIHVSKFCNQIIYLKMDSSIQKKVPLVSDKKLTLILVFDCYHNINTPTYNPLSTIINTLNSYPPVNCF